MKKQLFLVLCFPLWSAQSFAQCAMCRAVLESEDSQITAQGVNDGIVYLMIIPYVLVGGIGVAIFYDFKKVKKE